MKQKYLLSMLLGGAMLAACSVEDELNLAPVAQEVNPSAPVFNVSFDDGDPLTRAQWVNKGWKVSFNDEDRLSLFHGAQDDLTNWQNAIYSGSEDETTGMFKFTTQAMVQEGKAIMVYPGDDSFENEIDGDNNLGVNAPYIRIDQDQTPTSKNRTPYMSEILEILKQPVDGGNQAVRGFNKPYDIVLRRAAGILELSMDVSGPTEVEGVKPVTIKKVELNSKNKSFTTVVPVKSIEGTHTGTYKSWVNNSDLDFTSENLVADTYITTTDIEDNKKATFTLLPSKQNTSGQTNDENKLEDCEVVVYTTYGKVTLEKDNEGWIGKTENRTTTKALEAVLPRMYSTNTSGTWEDEKMGQHAELTIKVDLSTLDMNGMHIGDEGELMEAFAVYDVLSKDKEVKWTLDGGLKDNPSNKFKMSADTWKEVSKRLAKSTNKITLVPCTDEGEECTTILLDNTDGDDVEEVPALKFGGKVDVELIGAWKFVGEEKDQTVLTDKAAPRILQNVENLKFTEGTLTLKNYIASTNGKTDADKKNNETKIVVSKGVNVTVSGTVTLQMDMDNSGKINIGADDRLVVGANETDISTLINREAKGDNVNGFSVGGEIINKGTLAIVDGSNGKIENYGVIDLSNAPNARTLISRNADTADAPTQFKNLFGSSNRIGSIILNDKLGSNNNTSVDENPGFIKLEISADEVKYNGDLTDAKDNVGDIANYIVVKGSCAKVSSINTNNVKFIEIDNDGTEVVMNLGSDTAPQTLAGLVLRDGKKVNIPSNKGIAPAVIYVPNGEITKAGSLGTTYQLENGYYGGQNKDRNNIFTRK